MVTTFYPPHIGGIEYHVEALSKCLAKRGHQITVLTSMLPDKKVGSCDKISDGVDVFRLKTIFLPSWPYPALSSQGFTLNMRKTIKRLVKPKKIDLIHVHGHHYYLSWSAIAAARSLEIPSVLTLHGLYALNPTDLLAQIEEEIFNYTIFRQELRKVTAVIGLTPKITRYARKYGSLSKMYFTIPSGVNYKIFAANSKNRFSYRRKYSMGDDKFIVLFLGRFASIKGVLELAEASKLVVKKNNKVCFIFVGGGPSSRELAETLKPIKENVKIIGWKPFSEIHELYIASDLFVLPSKSEALPLTILEAMSAHLHIVTTPVGGIPDVLQMYPHKTFIKQLSPLGICEAILSAIAQTRGKLAEQYNSHSYMENFDWQNIACQIEKVYHEAITKSNEF
jgi:glycosyltransferase involved in cell wall biosynthesis